MKNKSKHTLQAVKTLPSGKIVAVHHWPTGWQMLEFPNREAFEKRRASVISQNA